MMKSINPKSIGLSARDRIVEITPGHLALVIDRKSRIIMADGRRILEKAEKVKSMHPEWRISLMTQTTICSKTRAFLSEAGVHVVDPVTVNPAE